MQGVVKSYDPASRMGSLIVEADLVEIDFAFDALDQSVFRFLRQGQRVNFDLDSDGKATKVRFGSELDMVHTPKPVIPD